MATTISSISFKDSSTWYSLLNLIYPVGALYGSTSSTSPANLFGGSWSQIKGAVLAATGANGYAAAAKTGGSLKMSISQLPVHNHSFSHNITNVWNSAGGYYICSTGVASDAHDTPSYNTNNTGGGGQTFCLTTMQHIGGSEPLSDFLASEDVIDYAQSI